MAQENRSDESRGLLVGDEPCTFVEVRDALIGSTRDSADNRWPKLLDVARSLDIPTDTVFTLKVRLPSEMTTYAGGLYEILEAWRAKKAETAKLDTLIKAFETNGLKESADVLRIRFKVFENEFVAEKLKEFKTWDALPDYLKSWANTKLVMFQGRQVKLEDIMHTTIPVDDKILEELSCGETPIIVNDTVPEKLEYYIHRTVTSRSKLKIQVLQNDSKDVFVIEGIEKYQLSSHVRSTETTDVSGNQRKKITARFILLQHRPDYEKICKIATTPVHWLRYKNEQFELVESSGPVENLQEYVDDSQDSCLEDDLASNQNQVFVMADSPGMGKTSLLANIAHQIMQEQDTTLVRFIVLKEFVQALNKKKINAESIIQVIVEQSSEYDFGKKIAEHALKSRPCILFFDGFDEVLSNQIESAKQILQAAATLPSVRIFLATRPHFRSDLEIALHVLGYTIQPFNESNQIQFLMKFWKIRGAIPNSSLAKFAESCIRLSSTNMKDSETNIAGIPLQCRLLAETYEEDAIRCSKIGYEAYDSANSTVLVRSMFETYEIHMNMRFEKICKQESITKRFLSFISKTPKYESVKQAHMYYALQMLFPDHANQFEYLNKQAIPINDLCGLGILEATHSKDIRFVHRTLAEFLVAWFIHEKKLYSSSHQQFVLSTIFKKTKHLAYFSHPQGGSVKINSFTFTFPVICYFINGFTKKEMPDNFDIKQYQDIQLPNYIASAFHDYECIPFAVTRYIDVKSQETGISASINKLLLITASYSGLDLMKVFCSNIDIENMEFLHIKKSEKSGEFMLTPLHVAVYCGHYSLVEYLFKKFERKLNELRYLIHFCVYKSRSNSKAMLENKTQIIKLLNSRSKQWINERLDDVAQTTPQMQSNAHEDLLECLIQEGANLTMTDQHGNTVLHKISDNYLPGESYQRLLEALNKQGFQHFNKPNLMKETPLQLAVTNVELIPKTLELFYSKGADFNSEDDEGDSVLFYAIHGGRSVDIIKKLIQFGADRQHENMDGQNVLHVSATYGNLSTLNFFIKTQSMDVNAQDKKHNTPLHHAVLEWSEKHESVHHLLINLGANVNMENENKKTPFLFAFEKGKALSLSTIQQMEEHGLKITPTIASKALKAAFLRFPNERSYYKADIEVLEYLMAKGGKMNFEFIHNFWNWEIVQDRMPDIIKHTTVSSKLLTDAKNRGLLTEKNCIRFKKLDECVQSKRFYEIVEQKPRSAELVYLILIGNQQKARDNLEECFSAAKDKLLSNMFVAPNLILKQFIVSENKNLIVLVTNSTELSVRKIRDTVEKPVTVISELDLDDKPMQNELVVLKCDVLTADLVNILRRFRGKLICVCGSFVCDFEMCEIVTDELKWEDVSSYYIDYFWFRKHENLYNVTELFATPKIIEVFGKHDIELGKLEEKKYFMYRDAEFKLRHATNDKYLSTTMFHSLLQDKLVYINIADKELMELAKHGHKIEGFEHMKSLNYIIVQQPQDFEEICKNANTNAHLIDYYHGRFRLLRTKGSDEYIRRFYESSNACFGFPFCDCNASDEIIANFLFFKNQDYEELLSHEVSIKEFLPKAKKVFGLQDKLDFFEIRRFLQRFQQQSIAVETLKQVESESKRIDNEISITVNELVKLLECSEDHLKKLKQVAVNTSFHYLKKDTQIFGLEKYLNMGLLRRKDSSLVFVNETLASYFIVKLILQPENVAYISLDNLKNEIFMNCFEKHQQPPMILKWRTARLKFESDSSFKFINSRLFKFLDASAKHKKVALANLITKYITPESAFKWIHSCVNANLLNLLQIVVGLEIHGNVFELEDLMVLAVLHADVPIIELVTQEYERQTGQRVAHMQLEFNNVSKMDHSIATSILHISVMEHNYSAVEYLLEEHFQETFNQREMQTTDNPSPLHLALLKPFDRQLELIRLLITYKVDVNARDSRGSTMLHFAVKMKHLHMCMVYIIKLLMENGVDPNVVDEQGHTFLYCAIFTFTPDLYAQLIVYLDSVRKNTITMVDSNNCSILHNTVRGLEPLESTLEIFKQNGINFNGIDKCGYSVLFHAIYGGRSASFLKTLMNYGADWTEPNQKQDSPLHWAAEYANLPALQLFILLGCDVNELNLEGMAPIHKAVQSKHFIEEIINELINHGADVNAKVNNVNCEDLNNCSPLHLAVFNHCDKQIELIHLLIDQGADVNARDSKEYTPLHSAPRQKPLPQRMMEIVRLLIESGADVLDEQSCTFLHLTPRFFTPELFAELIVYFDSTGRKSSFTMTDFLERTILHLSVMSLELLEETLEIFKLNGVNFNGIDKNGNSVLFYAVMGGRSASFLNILISFGTYWNISNKMKENPIHWATQSGNLPALKLFVSFGCDVKAPDIYGFTPLHKAVQSKQIDDEIINELVAHGADVNAKNNPGYWTPLHVTIIFNHGKKQLEIIGLLINQGADINAKSSTDSTPLHVAVCQKPVPPRVVEIVRLLIESGADPDAVDKNGFTFLNWAPRSLNAEMYHELIVYFDSTGRKDTLKAVTSHSFTHLHCAVENFEPLQETLKIFKSNGIDFNGQDNDGDSVVFDAIEGGRNAEFLQTLFTFGADWTISNKKKENTIHVAAYFGNLSALKLFISLGCDVNSPNINGHNPLHNAFLGKRYGQNIKTNHEVVVELLKHGADVNAKDEEGNLPIDLANKRLENGLVEKRTMHLLQV